MVKLKKDLSQGFLSLIAFLTSVSIHLATVTVTVVFAQNNAGLKLNTAEVADQVTIRTNVPLRLNVTCRGMNSGRDIYINSVTSRTFSRSRKHYQTFSVCCKFHRNGEHIPNLNRAFDDFYPMATVTESGKTAEITIDYFTITIKIGSQTESVKWGEKTYSVCHQPDIKRPIVSSSPGRAAPQQQNIQAQAQRPAVIRDFNPFVTSDSGKRCVSDCNRKGSSYEWCYVEQLKWDDTWDFCKSKGSSLVPVSTDGIVSSHGVPCASKCRKDGSDYKCTTFRSWWMSYPDDTDYCSPDHGYDYRGNRCSGICEYKNSQYKYCDLEKGSWGYCS